jgi:hypothetical protein
LSFDLDIYELDNGHIHAVAKGSVEGMIDFENSESFARFVTPCQQYIEDSRHSKKTMDRLTE